MKARRVLMVGAIALALSVVAYAAIQRGGIEPPQANLTSTAEAVKTQPAVKLGPVIAREQTEKIEPLLVSTDTEVVFGFTVRKDRTCTMYERYVEQDDGTLQRLAGCEPAAKPPGPYDNYDDHALSTMSYSDAGAAATLARRWAYDYPEEARMMALRAVALDSSNVKPIELLAWDQYSQDYDEDGIATQFVKEGYVLLRTAEVIKGAYVMDVDHSRNLLIEAGYTDEQIGILDRRVNREVGYIRDEQIELTGVTSIGGPEL